MLMHLKKKKLSSNNLKPYLPQLKNALNHFLDLLLSFPEITSEQKTAAEKIRHFDFEQYHDTVSWYVSLDIFDYELQMRQTNRKGPYMRSWSIWCEQGTLEIGAASQIDFNETEPSHFEFNFLYSFILDEVFPKSKTEFDFDSFIEDAKNYASYMDGHLNELDVDIDFWEQNVT